jgi:D-lactate dehydrogenase
MPNDTTISISIYDTKPYDRQYLTAAAAPLNLQLTFHDFRLTAETAPTAAGSKAVCAFVNDQLDAPCLKALAALGIKHIALRCAGFNNIDLPAAKSLGIAVTRVPAYSPHAVAEHTLALLLCLNRKIHRAYNRVREHNFSLAGLVGFDIAGKTVAIVGTGKIGRITAEIFRGFSANVIAYDPFPTPDWAAKHSITYLPFQDLLPKADILSLHLPLTPDTHQLLNDKTIAQMKPGSIILNTSRGKLIDATALITHLKTGHLAGVALDVYEEEEGVFFEDHSSNILADDTLTILLTLPNVLITSHQAFLTHEALSEIARVTTTNLAHLATAHPPLPGTTL